MCNKKFFMVLDTETFSNYKVFDIGYSVIDRNGRIYESGSYIVDDMFTDDDLLSEFVHDSFSAKNRDVYLSAYITGSDEFKIASFEDIRDEVNEVLNRYNATLCAYNVAFDLRALDKTTKLLLNEPKFLMKPIEILDIWAAALSCLCPTISYVQFATEHGFLTKTGKPRTAAEPVYCFLIDEPDFEELHMGYADVLIECNILIACFKTHKKLDKKPVGCVQHNPYFKRTCVVQTTYVL